MRHVELIPGKPSSVLGFGCAPVLGAKGPDVSRAAIHLALDLGITHFDLARSYGYGEAERFVGRLLRGRRAEVVIATKFGIRATALARALRPLKPLVRALRPPRRGPEGAEPSGPPPPPRHDWFHQRVAFSPETMRTSLHRSLQALGTDHVDILFLHEPNHEISRFEDLAAAAGDLKSQGKIRAWGLAYDSRTEYLHAHCVDRVDVRQFDLSPEAPHYAAAVQRHARSASVFFSPLRHRGGLDPASSLSRLGQDFPRSVVLCSMFREAHIRANAAAMSAAR